MKIEKMAPGMVLHRWGRDGTVMNRPCSWPVEIVSVDLVKRTVLASWNHNPPRTFRESDAKKWRAESYWDAQERKDKSHV